MIKKHLFVLNNARLPSFLKKARGIIKQDWFQRFIQKSYKIILNMGLYILNDMRVK